MLNITQLPNEILDHIMQYINSKYRLTVFPTIHTSFLNAYKYSISINRIKLKKLSNSIYFKHASIFNIMSNAMFDNNNIIKHNNIKHITLYDVQSKNDLAIPKHIITCKIIKSSFRELQFSIDSIITQLCINNSKFQKIKTRLPHTIKDLQIVGTKIKFTDYMFNDLQNLEININDIYNNTVQYIKKLEKLLHRRRWIQDACMCVNNKVITNIDVEYKIDDMERSMNNRLNEKLKTLSISFNNETTRNNFCDNLTYKLKHLTQLKITNIKIDKKDIHLPFEHLEKLTFYTIKYEDDIPYNRKQNIIIKSKKLTHIDVTGCNIENINTYNVIYVRMKRCNVNNLLYPSAYELHFEDNNINDNCIGIVKMNYVRIINFSRNKYKDVKCTFIANNVNKLTLEAYSGHDCPNIQINGIRKLSINSYTYMRVCKRLHVNYGICNGDVCNNINNNVICEAYNNIYSNVDDIDNIDSNANVDNNNININYDSTYYTELNVDEISYNELLKFKKC